MSGSSARTFRESDLIVSQFIFIIKAKSVWLMTQRVRHFVTVVPSLGRRLETPTFFYTEPGTTEVKDKGERSATAFPLPVPLGQQVT